MAAYLVTGGFGFIGANIVKRLVALGERVRVIDDLSTGRRENLADVAGSVEIIGASLLDREAVDAATDGVDYVLHQAAIPSVQRSIEDPERSHRVNVDGTLALLEACRRSGVKRVVYAASSSAYGDQPALVKSEKLLPLPKSPYAVSKLSAEYYLQAYSECFGVETVALRYFNVFGPHQDPASEYSAVIPRFITRCLAGESPIIYGDGGQSRDFTYVENNVEANLLASRADGVSGEVFNIACGHSYSLLDLLSAINTILGTNVEPEFAAGRKGDVRHSLADISKAQKMLGYEVKVGFEEGLRRTVEWYRGAKS
jgi:UDP-glucose 4-epimerase